MIRSWILVLTALAIVACEEFPTEAPMWEQTWALPGEDIIVGPADVLPATVSVTADGTAFETVAPGTDIQLSVGQMCSACQALDGSTAPKPAFTYTFNTTTSLPSELVSASVTGDQFALRLAHDLSFDPLRPSSDPADPRGYLLVEISSAGAVLARDSISGDDVAFDASVVLTPVLPIQPADATSTLDIDLTIFSPAGDDVQVDASDTLGIEVQPATVTFSEVTVQATGIAVDAIAAELDFAGVDSTLVDRIQSGVLRLEVDNPLDLQGTLDLDFDTGSQTTHKSLALAPGQSTLVLDFTATELRTLIGAGSVEVTAQGSLSASDGTITLQPGTTLVMESTFELVVLVGGEGGN